MKRDTTPAAELSCSPDTVWRRVAIALGGRFPSLRAGAVFRLPFSADTLLASALILLVASAAVTVCQWQRLQVPVSDGWHVLALVVALLVGAGYYRARGEHSFVLCLSALAKIVAFAACYIVLMYAVTTLNRPLVDAELAAFDDCCSLTAPVARRWAEAHPAMATILMLAYDTLLYQTALVVAVLGLVNDRRRLAGFVQAFMFSALMAIMLFILFPAEGPFARFRFAASPDQTTFLEHFKSLRDGSRTIVSLRASEGLITFPSFHVVWAILLTWAFRGRRLFFAAAIVVNSLVIVSTMTTGWHYFADVLGGAAVALTAIGMTTWLRTNDE